MLLSLMGSPDSSAGKESTCNAGDSTLIPGSGRSPGEGIGSGTPGYSSIPGLLCGSDGKESTYNAGHLGSIPGLGRSPGEENPLQYSCLENSTDRGAWQAKAHGVANSRTQMSNFHFLFDKPPLPEWSCPDGVSQTLAGESWPHICTWGQLGRQQCPPFPASENRSQMTLTPPLSPLSSLHTPA